MTEDRRCFGGSEGHAVVNERGFLFAEMLRLNRSFDSAFVGGLQRESVEWRFYLSAIPMWARA